MTNGKTNGVNGAKNPEESQPNIAVSLPQMATESQFEDALCNVTEPIKRERASKEKMLQKK